MSFRDQGRTRDHKRTIMALGADEDNVNYKERPQRIGRIVILVMVLSRPVAQCS